MLLTNKEEIVFTTVATAGYLPQATVMAKSVKKHMPGTKVIVCIVEKKVPPKTESILNTCFDEIILAKNLGFTNFNQFIFQYNRFEGANACKAQLLIHLLENNKNHNFIIFLDADTKVYGPFFELAECLKTSEIVFSPHFIRFNKKQPFTHLGTVHRSGIFNTGYLAIKRGNESHKFLQWWAKILLKHCYKDLQKGLWNEQKWLDLTTGLFNYFIQTDPGYNVGPWNFHERLLTLDSNGEYLVNGKPLCLFHFSGLYSNYFNHEIEKSDHNQKSIINKIRKQYLQDLQETNIGLSRNQWSYNCFINGHQIDKESRLIYRNKPGLFKDLDNPFLKDNQFFKLTLKRRNNKEISKKTKGSFKTVEKNLQ